MREPQRRERILSEVAAPDAALGFISWDKLYPMTDPPNYEPTAEESVAARAASAGQTPLEFAYERSRPERRRGRVVRRRCSTMPMAISTRRAR